MQRGRVRTATATASSAIYITLGVHAYVQCIRRQSTGVIPASCDCAGRRNAGPACWIRAAGLAPRGAAARALELGGMRCTTHARTHVQEGGREGGREGGSEGAREAGGGGEHLRNIIYSYRELERRERRKLRMRTQPPPTTTTPHTLYIYIIVFIYILYYI